MCGKDQNSIMVSGGFRFIPDKSDNGKWTTSLEVRWKRFGLGVDYRPLTERFGPIASIRLLDETKFRPAVVVGTGPDQFGGIYSQAYFATVSKRISMPYGIGVSPFVGFGYIQELDDPERFIRGVIVRKDDYSMQLYHNGFTTHFVASVDLLDHHTLSFVYWGLDQPGFSYTFRF